MELVYVRSRKEYFLNRFPQSIKNNKLEYFKKGIGHKTTKAFDIIQDNELLEMWDKNINELYVAKIYDKYGVEVACEYANCLTAGIVAREFANGYGTIYQKIKDILPNNFSNDFFKLLKCDYYLSIFGCYSLDICKLDETFSKLDPNYNANNTTYKNKPCSMKEYIEIKYGADYVKIIDRILE